MSVGKKSGVKLRSNRVWDFRCVCLLSPGFFFVADYVTRIEFFILEVVVCIYTVMIAVECWFYELSKLFVLQRIALY